ncbi:hypothetical protein [Vibrio algarum]|uniref:Threonine transporter RhtB n=1 Tax=Vibrio algarum TaxID=3020714 RepID=A0ABT4YU32_9VIBR|nr:hypothetical protein [Vibrio sp. KJ40-1]MDB1124975.1 hypothetical protein [Vibrio sp. KJ40-1]
MLVVIGVCSFIIMVYQVWRIPNFDGATIYKVSYSPDGLYKMSGVYSKSLSNKSYSLLTSLKDNRLVAIVPSGQLGTGEKDSWTCSQIVEIPCATFFPKSHPKHNASSCIVNSLIELESCVEYVADINDKHHTISLPPSYWQQLHAWFVVMLQGKNNGVMSEN